MISDCRVEKTNRRRTSSRRVEVGSSYSQGIWITSMHLPPPNAELGVSERMEVLEFQFGPWDKEHRRSFTSNSVLGAKKAGGKKVTCLDILTLLADGSRMFL